MYHSQYVLLKNHPWLTGISAPDGGPGSDITNEGLKLQTIGGAIAGCRRVPFGGWRMGAYSMSSKNCVSFNPVWNLINVISNPVPLWPMIFISSLHPKSTVSYMLTTMGLIPMKFESRITTGGGGPSLYMQYRGCANIKGVVILTKNARERVCFLDKNAWERVCFSAEGVLLDGNSKRHYSAILFIKGYIFCQICKKNSMFSTNELQERGCLFHKFRKRKGMVSKAVLAHLHSKIRQVPPSWGLITLFNSWECEMAKLAQCQECDKLHITLSENFFLKNCQKCLFWPKMSKKKHSQKFLVSEFDILYCISYSWHGAKYWQNQ